MGNHDQCDTCADPASGMVSSPLLLRSEAVALYFRLASQGQFPSMCEQRNGTFRVCYAEQGAAALREPLAA